MKELLTTSSLLSTRPAFVHYQFEVPPTPPPTPRRRFATHVGSGHFFKHASETWHVRCRKHMGGLSANRSVEQARVSHTTWADQHDDCVRIALPFQLRLTALCDPRLLANMGTWTALWHPLLTFSALKKISTNSVVIYHPSSLKSSMFISASSSAYQQAYWLHQHLSMIRYPIHSYWRSSSHLYKPCATCRAH